MPKTQTRVNAPKITDNQLSITWQTHTIANTLDTLKTQVAPKVSAAYFSTIWNRWNTHRRWQGKCCTPSWCLLCQQDNTTDSIEHYARCLVVKIAMSKYLNLDPYYYHNLHSILQVNPHIKHIDTAITLALLTYGIYTTTNSLRQLYKNNTNPPQQPDLNFTYDLLIQNIKNGTANHTNSTRTLDQRWMPH